MTTLWVVEHLDVIEDISPGTCVCWDWSDQNVAKKHPRSQGVFNYNVLSELQKEKLLHSICVEEVWGIGRKLTQRLAHHEIHSVLDLREAHTPTLRAEFGVLVEKTQRELRELSCMDLQEIQPHRQQIISSRSFGKAVTELPMIKDALSLFVANACSKLRSENSHAGMIQVFLQTNRFRENLPQYMPCLAAPLSHPTSDSLEINHWASKLCDLMFRSGYQYKRAGVILSEICPVNHSQGDLLAQASMANDPLMLAIDVVVIDSFTEFVKKILSSKP